jgi:cardiolipin synthase
MEPLPAWYLRRRAHYLPGNEVRLLEGGQELFAAFIAAVKKARYEVWLTTYIFHHDESARAVAQALSAAAQRGVRVRVVVDGFGSIQSVATLRQWWARSPVSLAVYRPLDRWWTLLQSEHLRRLHQKVAVVDSEIGFVGGINVIDDCIDLHDGPQSTPRLDYAIQVRGPVVAPMAQAARAMWTRAAFGADWRDEVAQMVRGPKGLVRARELLRSMRRAPRPVSAAPAALSRPTEPSIPGTVEAAFLLRDNLRQRHSVQAALLQACAQARHEIDIACPYFYPGRVLRRALLQAAQRGVRVRLLLQGRPDYRIAALAAKALYGELLSGGVQIFEYGAAALHAKVVRVDERWATVGSSNLDPLSLLVNFEANLAIRDGGFAREVARALELAFGKSRAVVDTPVAVGWAGALRRRAVALLARLYLRLAGVPSNY